MFIKNAFDLYYDEPTQEAFETYRASVLEHNKPLQYLIREKILTCIDMSFCLSADNTSLYLIDIGFRGDSKSAGSQGILNVTECIMRELRYKRQTQETSLKALVAVLGTEKQLADKIAGALWGFQDSTGSIKVVRVRTLQ